MPKRKKLPLGRPRFLRLRVADDERVTALCERLGLSRASGTRLLLSLGLDTLERRQPKRPEEAHR